MEKTPHPVSRLRDFHERPARIRNDLKHSLLRKLAITNPSLTITSVHNSYIDRRLQELFQSFPTPTHPPYALMIQTAVTDLNEEGGSYEEGISEFMEKVFGDLPWAHQTILGRHLRILCENEELVRTESGKYMLPPRTSDLLPAREVAVERFGGSKDKIVERSDEIDGKTDSPDSQIKCSGKNHPRLNAEEHLGLEEDQVRGAESWTKGERQTRGVTGRQAKKTTVEFREDMSKEGEKWKLDEEQALRSDVGVGAEPAVSKEKSQNAIVLWDKEFRRQKKLKRLSELRKLSSEYRNKLRRPTYTSERRFLTDGKNLQFFLEV